jgi:hypothetical protein
VQIVIGAEAVGITPLACSVADEVRASGVAIRAERADQIAVARDVLEPVEGRDPVLEASFLDVVDGSVVLFGYEIWYEV